MTAHGDQTGLLLQRDDFLRILKVIGQRNFHLHMFAGFQAGDGLRGVHLRGRAQDDGVEFRQSQAVSQLGGDVLDAVLASHFLRLFQVTANQRDHLHAVNVFDAVQMLDAEGAGAGECYFGGHSSLRRTDSRRREPPWGAVNEMNVGVISYLFSRIKCPTAVLDAGTWKKRCLRWTPSARPATSLMAPRAISHITSSMPSLPASRT